MRGVGAVALAALALATAARAEPAPPARASPSIPARRTLTLLYVTDLHAQLESHPEVLAGEPGFPLMGGLARVRTVLDRERARASGPVFTVDGGDDLQGSAPAAWSRGEVVVKPLRALGFDVGGWGDADLAYGAARFRDLARHAGFRRIGDSPPGDDPRDGLPASATIRRGGVKVAFVATSARGARGDDLRRLVAALRHRERPDLVVAIVRGGTAVARTVAREAGDLDVVLTSGAHERSDDVAVEGRSVIVRAGALGSFVARLDIDLGPAGPTSHAFRLLPVRADTVPEHGGVKALVDAQLAPYRDRMSRVVGRTATAIVRDGALETSADNLITDAIREVAGTQIALAQGRHDGVPIPPGAITEGQLWSLVPEETRVKRGWATGRQLRERLEQQFDAVFGRDGLDASRGPRAAGIEVTLSASPPPGLRRVWSVHFAAAPLRQFDVYTIAASAQPGEPGGALAGIADAQGVTDFPLTLQEILLRYLANHRVVRPRKDQRIAATDTRLARQDAGDASPLTDAGPGEPGEGATAGRRPAASVAGVRTSSAPRSRAARAPGTTSASPPGT